MKQKIIVIVALMAVALTAPAQELNCKVKVNRSAVQGTSSSVFEKLETAISEFMNQRAWTDMQYDADERIDCSLTITVKQYKADGGSFACELQYQCTRPVYGSAYNTTILSMRDTEFTFNYQENDVLEFNEVSMNNNLTAMLAYYAYLFIGVDLDTFSPMGGTDVLHRVEAIVNNAQSMSGGGSGWSAFSDSKNRHAIINDYMSSAMQPLRQLMYKYHREGLDQMSDNADRGRAAITSALPLLSEAHQAKTMSLLPQYFTDFKRDELVGIYRGHGTEGEKSKVYDILADVNASQIGEWKKMQK